MGQARPLTGRRPLPTLPAASSAVWATRAGSHRGTPTARGPGTAPPTLPTQPAASTWRTRSAGASAGSPSLTGVLMSFQPGTLSPIALLEHRTATGPRRASRQTPRHEGYAHRANVMVTAQEPGYPRLRSPRGGALPGLQTRNWAQHYTWSTGGMHREDAGCLDRWGRVDLSRRANGQRPHARDPINQQEQQGIDVAYRGLWLNGSSARSQQSADTSHPNSCTGPAEDRHAAREHNRRHPKATSP